MSTTQAFQVAINVVNAIPGFGMSLPGTMLECFFFGLYTTVAFGAYRAFPPALPRTRAGWTLLGVCVAMYAFATTHLALRLRWLAFDYGQTSNLRAIAAICMRELAMKGSGATCFDFGSDYNAVRASLARAGHGWILDMFLVINIVLSTGILLWREYARAQTHKKAIGAVSVVAILALIPMCIVGTYVDDGLESGFGTAALTIAWIIALGIAALGSLDIWRRRNEIMNSTHGLQGVVRAVELLLESGILYAAFWTVILAWCAVIWDGKSTSGFVSGIHALNSGALIDIVAMYPTLLLVLSARPKRVQHALFAASLPRDARRSMESDVTANAPRMSSDYVPKAGLAHESHESEGESAGMV